MAETALILTGIFSAGAAIAQGRAVAAAEKERRRQLEQQKALTNIKAMDDANQRRKKLEQALGTGAAIGGASGFDPAAAGSSFLALREETEKVAEEDVSMIRLLGVSEIGRLSAEQSQSRIAGRAAVTGGFLKAGAALADTGFKRSQLKSKTAVT